MIIDKITTGYVIQKFDTEKQEFISQSFVAGEVEYEHNGQPICCADLEAVRADNKYLPFDMIQPNDVVIDASLGQQTLK